MPGFGYGINYELRPVPPGDRGRPAARVSRRLARDRLALADPAPRRVVSHSRVRSDREGRRRRRRCEHAAGRTSSVLRRRAARPADRRLRRPHGERAAAVLRAGVRRVRHRHLQPGRLPPRLRAEARSRSASRRCSTRPSRPARARSCGSCRSTSSSRARCATSCRATSRRAATLRHVLGQGRDPAERHAPRARRRGARAAVRRRARAVASRRRSRSRSAASPTPTTRCCPRRSSAGPSRCSRASCRAICRSSSEINAHFLAEVEVRWPGNIDRAARALDHRGGPSASTCAWRTSRSSARTP